MNERIDDIGMAHEMALAGNEHESEAARLRQFGEAQMKRTLQDNRASIIGIAAVTIHRLVPKIEDAQREADIQYAAIEGKQYDIAAEALHKLKVTKR